MTDFRIPRARVPGLKILLKMPEESLISFEKAVKNIPKGLHTMEIVDRLAEKEVLEKDEADELIGVLSDLYNILSEEQTGLDELVDGIGDALIESGDDSLKPTDGDWDKFKGHLKILLSLESSLGISFKASRLLAQNEKTYVEAKIYSDIRPAFHLDVESGFDIAVIIHNLQIEFHKGRTHEEIQIALDCEDIRELKELIDRAEDKEIAIRRQLKDSILFLPAPPSKEKK